MIRPKTHLTALLDDNSELEPPDPFPNSDVKRFSADGSVGSPHVRVGHRQALITNTLDQKWFRVFFYLKSGSGKGHGTATGTRREPIPGGLGIASLLCTVPVAAPQPLPLEHRGYST